MKNKSITDETGALTREFLLARGHCCNSGCKNCPYKECGEVTECASKPESGTLELNGLTYRKPFRSEFELQIHHFFSTIPNLEEKVGKIDVTKMLGQEKKDLIDRICKEYGIRPLSTREFGN